MGRVNLCAHPSVCPVFELGKCLFQCQNFCFEDAAVGAYRVACGDEDHWLERRACLGGSSLRNHCTCLILLGNRLSIYVPASHGRVRTARQISVVCYALKIDTSSSRQDVLKSGIRDPISLQSLQCFERLFGNAGAGSAGLGDSIRHFWSHFMEQTTKVRPAKVRDWHIG